MGTNERIVPVNVRAVYSADRFLCVSDDNSDFVLCLPGCRCFEVQRPCDPPFLTWRLYPEAAAKGRFLEPGPCPDGRRAAERLIRDREPWFANLSNVESAELCDGNRVFGDLKFTADGQRISVRGQLLKLGHLADRDLAG